MLCLKIIIKGKVYKTDYRYFIKQKASQLNINGFVFYYPDFSVGVIASGSNDNLDEFIRFCRIGNKDSYINNLNVEKVPCTDFTSFEVIDNQASHITDAQYINNH
ncbi:MAG: acylphosphatase [Bacteroidales bacterium]|nr:acylphosphatase [Bacteroidales bacterium]